VDVARRIRVFCSSQAGPEAEITINNLVARLWRSGGAAQTLNILSIFAAIALRDAAYVVAELIRGVKVKRFGLC
jgi:hypothetical protein